MACNVSFFLSLVLCAISSTAMSTRNRLLKKGISCRKLQLAPIGQEHFLHCVMEKDICTSDHMALNITGCSSDPLLFLPNLLLNNTEVDKLTIDRSHLSVIPEEVCKDMTGLTHLRLAHNDVKSIPNACFQTLTRLQVLELQYNQIKYLTSAHFTGLVNISTVDFSGNDISSVSKVFWLDLLSTTIDTLDLSSNNISESCFLSVQNHSLQPIQEVHLYHNPFTCDCESLWFKSWLLKNNESLTYITDIKCYNSVTKNSMPVTDVEDDDFLCQEGTRFTTGIITSSTALDSSGEVMTMAVALICIVVGLPVIALVTFLILYKERMVIYGKIHTHPFDRDECEGEGKEFDVFFSCNTRDELWAEVSIVNFLRQKMFKVCWHRDHFLPGQPIIHNIGEGIDKSKRTLCLLNKNFISSNICMYELMHSLSMDMLNKRRRTIIINCKDYETSTLDEFVRNYMKTHTYIDLHGKNFHRDLLYALPVARLGFDRESEGNDHTINVSHNIPLTDWRP